MRYIVHVGRHKTGTTALQRRFAASTRELMEHGVLYPEVGRRPFGHHELADAIGSSSPGGPATPIIAELRDEIEAKSPHTIVVSSEALQGVAPNRLAAVFPPHETTIVLYIREQVDYLISGYAQRVQATDLCVPFEEYVEKHRKAVDYLPWLRRFERSFGNDNMVVRVYDRELLIGGSTLSDFLAALGLSDLPIERDGSIDTNPSLDFPSLRLKLLANGLGLAGTDESRSALYSMFRKALQEPGSRGAGLSVQRSLQESLRKDYARHNRKVFSQFVDLEQRQFRFRDLSSTAGRRSTDELDVVFEIVESWAAVGGQALIHDLLMPRAPDKPQPA
jgi:hypothetical protein